MVKRIWVIFGFSLLSAAQSNLSYQLANLQKELDFTVTQHKQQEAFYGPCSSYFLEARIRALTKLHTQAQKLSGNTSDVISLQSNIASALTLFTSQYTEFQLKEKNRAANAETFLATQKAKQAQKERRKEINWQKHNIPQPRKRLSVSQDPEDSGYMSRP